MKNTYPVPPEVFRKALGDEAYDYLEKVHGLIQGLGDGDGDVGSLNVRNFGIRETQPGALVVTDSDGITPRVMDPLIQNLRSTGEGYLRADAAGQISAGPVPVTERVEFITAPTDDEIVITPPELVVGGAEEEARRYALLVSWMG